MKPWFRVYNSILNDPKLLALSLDNQALFIKFLAVSNLFDAGGTLPKLEVISKMIGCRIDKVRSAAKAMVDVGLLTEDVESQSFTVYGWKAKQFESDDASARSKLHRETKRNVAGGRGCNVAKTAPRACATDYRLQTTEGNTPLYPPDHGGAHTPRIAPDSVALDESDPMAERHRIADVAERRWGPQGLDTAESLLNLYPPAVVSYAAEQTFASFGRTLDMHGMRTWRKICREHPSGPPSPRVASGPTHGSAPPARPLTEHQRKRAKIAELRRTMRDAEADDESVGVPSDGHAHGPAQPARRA